LDGDEQRFSSFLSVPCHEGHITGHGHAGAVYNKQILSSRTVQRQAGVVFLGMGFAYILILHADCKMSLGEAANIRTSLKKLQIILQATL
jgi:hypothetical protein